MGNKLSLSLIFKAPLFKKKNRNSFESVHLLSIPSSSNAQAQVNGRPFQSPLTLGTSQPGLVYLRRRFPGGKIFISLPSPPPSGLLVCSWAAVVLDVRAALWGLEKRSEKPRWENPRETERPEHGRKKSLRTEAVKAWLRQEVGRMLFSVCSWEQSWKVLWWVCVWKKGL